MVTKRAAFGAQLQLADDPEAASPTWATVGGLGDAGFPLGIVENEDVTTHDSPDRYREFVQTVRDGGEISYALQYDWEDATHQQLTEASAEFGPQRFKVIAPDGTELAIFHAFAGLDATGGLPVTGSVTATLNLRTTGAVELPFLTS
jgi:hypothetical protein